MEQKPSFKEKLRYAVDNTFSRGPGALILWLGIISLAIIIVAGLIVSLFKIPVGDPGEPISFSEAVWESLMRTLDAGTMGGDTGWGFRAAMLVVTIGGVFVISTLIGILTSGVESKLESLRKGRSRVLENHQTILLGWTEQIFTILSELIQANENQPRSTIVIMANKDKLEMEEEIRERIGATGNTRIVCRTGNPLEISDLNIISLNTSKSIILLSPADSDEADAEVIKTILAIVNYPDHRPSPYHITAELRRAENGEVAKMVGKDEVEIVQTGDIISRIIAQTCRQSGLSVVYTELMDFDGDEIYTPEIPELTGKTYAQTLLAFKKNAVMGIVKKGQSAALNPAMNTILETGDKLIVVAADDDQIFLNGEPAVDEKVISRRLAHPNLPEQTLILGWNWRGARVLRELDNYVAPGSQVMVIADCDEFENKAAALKDLLRHQILTFKQGDITDRKLLESLSLAEFSHIILLSYCDDLDGQKADAKTLITLLHLRDIEDKSSTQLSVVSEMMDIRNRNLAEVAQADDFIVSDKLISLLLTQVSENKLLNSVFTDLFDPEGSEVYLCPVTDFVQAGVPVNFYTVVESASRQGKTAIGYRLMDLAHQADAAYGVVLNPEKSQTISFSSADKVILLAED